MLSAFALRLTSWYPHVIYISNLKEPDKDLSTTLVSFKNNVILHELQILIIEQFVQRIPR